MSKPNPGANLCRSDPLLMLADVTRLVAEHWGGDEALIRAIYEHQIATTGRQPTLQQARDYLGYLTTSIDSVTLRETLGLPPVAAAVFETVAAPSPVPDRRRGRPGWTPGLFWAGYRDARSRARPPRTYPAIAAQFELLDGQVGTDPDHLRKLVKRYGLPPD